MDVNIIYALLFGTSLGFLVGLTIGVGVGLVLAEKEATRSRARDLPIPPTWPCKGDNQ